ncbi:Domain of uncharacterised function (DUF1883) [Klebsiella pneumoniae]|nr:Domain of uncharacterised function (DUF1883) [Klebsiella pneumoniae]
MCPLILCIFHTQQERSYAYTHSRDYMEGGSIVSVQCSHQINVLVMDDAAYNRYKRGESCKVYGGFYKQFPANIVVRTPVTGMSFWLSLPGIALHTDIQST